MFEMLVFAMQYSLYLMQSWYQFQNFRTAFLHSNFYIAIKPCVVQLKLHAFSGLDNIQVYHCGK